MCASLEMTELNKRGEIRIMNKQQYDEPIMNILCFKGNDVIRTSDNWTDPTPDLDNY